MYTAHNDVFTQGAGYLDLEAAVKSLWAFGYLIPKGTAMSPVAVYNAATGNVTLVSDQTALWGANPPTVQTALWGAGTTTGSTALWGAATPDSQ